MNRLVSVGPYNVFNARYRSDSSAAAGITDKSQNRSFRDFAAMPQVSDVWHEAPQEVTSTRNSSRTSRPLLRSRQSDDRQHIE